ncbi:MAG: transcription termination factor NusA [Clostridiales bacterium]|jgi:N utilization substance protein A|nr:transcription termination factor NusA [Clostridiales bacterium]
MNNALDLIEALNQIERERGISKELIYEAVETSLISACKKNFGTSQNIKVIIDRQTGQVDVWAQKDVVASKDEVEDSNLQMTLEDALKINPDFKVGDVADIIVTPRDFGRISAQTAKQVVVQKFREAEREILFNEYIAKEREIVTGIVQRKERKNVYVALGKIDATLPQNEQTPGEEYSFGDRIKVYVVEVKQTTKLPLIQVSRTHPELIKRLFEHESPEVYSGVVEIKSIAREPGSRTKIAVYSNNKDVDPIGACVGQNGSRVNVIVDELRGEKIDIINWDADPVRYITYALNPCKALAVKIEEDEKNASVIVPDNQLSLAIGRNGQNVRLAARLTGWRIDIKSESQTQDDPLENYQIPFEDEFVEVFKKPETWDDVSQIDDRVEPFDDERRFDGEQAERDDERRDPDGE